MMNEVNIDNSLLLDILKSGPVSIVVIDKDTLNIEFCNDQFIQLFCNGDLNYRDEVHSFAEKIDLDHQERLKAQLNDVTSNISAKSKYMVYFIRSGEITAQVYIYASPLGDETSRQRRLYQLVILSDISKLHLPFISFDTRELFFKQFNNIDFGTFEWFLPIRKGFWTDGIYHIYEEDRTVEELDLTLLERVTHNDDKEKIRRAIDTALANGDEIDIEYRIMTRNNNPKTIHALAKFIYDQEGSGTKLVGSIRDVTVQRKTEEELRNSVSILNRSNKDLEEFAYVASHDLQEPLRKISTFSDRLNEKYKDVLTGDGTMYLERMMASAENMRTLINNLLEFSRISKSTLPFSRIDLNFILQQVKMDLELKIEETGTMINSDRLPVINASMTQMKQLFENIINNAIKFRKTGITPVIDITTSILSAEETFSNDLSNNTIYHKIQITDNGIGFEEEYATRIFQIFQRLHGKTEYPGSGIGLAICKKILEHHNGIIYAENIPGVGARFIMILPERQPDKTNEMQ